MSVLFIILLIVFSLPCIIGSFIYACVTSHTKVSVLTVVLLLLFGAVISVIIYLIRVENNANKATDSNEVKKDGNKVETIDVDAEIQEVQKLLDKDMINEEESGLMVQEIMKR
ncbi:hypothetical protein [Mycoplasma marinum]|uniref:Uncharacterized protein n=2 Tax=Mycoplasma marinum TaxID=1937190 RepID=A0A4R0XW36_9MOLU|nr:hypothetical protein [Mycoplasma marinum]TCG11171.1 hypothetical protein C4B24_02715 [Mycoplasma marinum]